MSNAWAQPDENEYERGIEELSGVDSASATVAPLHIAAPEPDQEAPLTLGTDALVGIPGEFVTMLEPHSEADTAALLVQFLVAAGNAVGRTGHLRVEADRHHGNLFAVIVGGTSTGRKGTSWGRVRQVVSMADPEWGEGRIKSGLASGEGLIYNVRDATEASPNQRDEPDPGVTDKRLLVYEPEFSRVLAVMSRQGNTSSELIRSAWDTGKLATLTRSSALQATGAHVSIIAHITPHELRRRLGREDIANGFLNRFLIVHSRRSKFLPDGGSLSDETLEEFGARLRARIAFVRDHAAAVHRDEAARVLWHDVYRDLSEGTAGPLGEATSRGAAQVTRLSVVYALLDASDLIREEHLLAALAVWRYCEASARYVLGGVLRSTLADRITELLRREPGGLTRTELSKKLGHHVRSQDVADALAELGEFVQQEQMDDTGGRPTVRLYAK